MEREECKKGKNWDEKIEEGRERENRRREEKIKKKKGKSTLWIQEPLSSKEG